MGGDGPVKRIEIVFRWGTLGLLAFGMGWVPLPLVAQEGPFAFQLRGGGTVPVGSFEDDARGWEEGTGQGTSLSMGFTFPLFRLAGGYLGFSQYRFACDADVCPKGKDWLSTGFDIALRAVIGDGGVRPWLQAGFHNHRVQGRISEEGGRRRINSDGGGGYEVGGGLLIAVGERTSLSPGLRYGLGNVPFPGYPNLGLRFLVLDLGLVLGF